MIENLTTHCQDARIVFNVELQTSFWHSRITFFQNFELRKVGRQAKFHLQKPIRHFKPPKRLWIEFDSRMLEMSKKMSLPTLL